MNSRPCSEGRHAEQRVPRVDTGTLQLTADLLQILPQRSERGRRGTVDERAPVRACRRRSRALLGLIPQISVQERVEEPVEGTLSIRQRMDQQRVEDLKNSFAINNQ